MSDLTWLQEAEATSRRLVTLMEVAVEYIESAIEATTTTPGLIALLTTELESVSKRNHAFVLDMSGGMRANTETLQEQERKIRNLREHSDSMSELIVSLNNQLRNTKSTVESEGSNF